MIQSSEYSHELGDFVPDAHIFVADTLDHDNMDFAAIAPGYRPSTSNTNQLRVQPRPAPTDSTQLALRDLLQSSGVCPFFLTGACTRANCTYSHDPAAALKYQQGSAAILAAAQRTVNTPSSALQSGIPPRAAIPPHVNFLEDVGEAGTDVPTTSA